MATLQPDFAEWLAAGAPSDDADQERPDRQRERADGPKRHDRWHGTDDPAYTCTCHIDYR
jgi:hypothetical protein